MTPHPAPIDPAVLGRYLDGTATPADLGAIEVWVAADLERRAALAALREAWAADARRLAAPYSVDAAWARFAARVGLGAGASPGASARRWRGAETGRRGALAAAIVAVLPGGGWGLWAGRAEPVAAPPPMRAGASTARGAARCL